jgi:hypothetical protein
LTVNTAPSATALVALAATTPSGLSSDAHSTTKSVASRLAKGGGPRNHPSDDPVWAMEQGERAAAGSSARAMVVSPIDGDLNGGLSEDAAYSTALAASTSARDGEVIHLEDDDNDGQEGEGASGGGKPPPRAAPARAPSHPVAAAASSSSSSLRHLPMPMVLPSSRKVKRPSCVK